MNKDEPCPFCGSTDIVLDIDAIAAGIDQTGCVRCNTCQATGPIVAIRHGLSQDTSAAAQVRSLIFDHWNRRQSLADLFRQKRELREMLSRLQGRCLEKVSTDDLMREVNAVLTETADS